MKYLLLIPVLLVKLIMARIQPMVNDDMVNNDDSYDSGLMSSSSSEESSDDDSDSDWDTLPSLVAYARGTETLPNSNTIRYYCAYSYTTSSPEPPRVLSADYHYLFTFHEDMSAAVQGSMQLETRDECKPEFVWQDATHGAFTEQTDDLNVRHWWLERKSITDEEAGKKLFLRLPETGSDGQSCAYSVSQWSLIFFTENGDGAVVDNCELGAIL